MTAGKMTRKKMILGFVSLPVIALGHDADAAARRGQRQRRTLRRTARKIRCRHITPKFLAARCRRRWLLRHSPT